MNLHNGITYMNQFVTYIQFQNTAQYTSKFNKEDLLVNYIKEHTDGERVLAKGMLHKVSEILCDNLSRS